MTIGDRLSIIRAEFFANNNDEFAKAAGIHPSNASNLINGKSEPSSKVLKNLLLSISQLSPDWLLFGVGDIRRVAVNVGDNSGNVAGVNNGTMIADNSKLIDTVHSQQKLLQDQHGTIDKLVALLAQK